MSTPDRAETAEKADGDEQPSAPSSPNVSSSRLRILTPLTPADSLSRHPIVAAVAAGLPGARGRAIRALRQQLHVRQAELARRMERSKSQVCAWETGVYEMPWGEYGRALDVLLAEQKLQEDAQALKELMKRWPTLGKL